jgi:hypothetical protein
VSLADPARPSRPSRLSRPSRPSHLSALLRVLTLLLAVGGTRGCSTTGAQIAGPVFGAGLEIDTDGRLSPRVQVGYMSAFWYDMLGYGGGVGVGWAPLPNRVELFGEVQAFAVPLFGFPLTPWSLGGLVAYSPVHGWEGGFRWGLEVWMFKPPDACWPPLGGPWDGCPPGVRTSDDVVYPEWLPRIAFRGALLLGLETEDHRGVFSLGFDPVLALWHLQGARP